MIVAKKNQILVSAIFDSGHFTGNFNVHKYTPESYNEFETNIQSGFKLTKEDFEVLEAVIAIKVDEFITMKKRENI